MGTGSHRDQKFLLATPLITYVNLGKSYNFCKLCISLKISKLRIRFDLLLHKIIIKTTQANVYECDMYIDCYIDVLLFAYILKILDILQSTAHST